MRRVYLHPGLLVASAEPCQVTTILGSCVAVCLWDAGTGVGGINHFLLPHFAGRGAGSPRFGNVAMQQLVDEVLAAGATRPGLRARAFGGASVLESLRGPNGTLGPKNVELARRFLRDAAIPLVGEDVLGDRGRRLTFRTDDGSVVVRTLSEVSHGSD